MEARERAQRRPGGKAAEPKSCEQCSRWKEIRKKLRVQDLLETAIRKLRERFEAQDFKPSVADYLKLVEMEDELEQSNETLKEIKVTWVEPKESVYEK